MLRHRNEPKVRINEKIQYNTPEVRVIGPQGEQLGIFKTSEAVGLARGQGLQLVEVAPAARPPVCRILDYGRYKYEEAKKQKAAKAKQHVIKIKEIKFRPKTDSNDYSYRVERGRSFLAKGYKLKATVVFRGRELAHVDYGARWFKQMEEDLKDVASMEVPVRQEGKHMSTVFAPLKNPVKASIPTPAPSAE